ncbi:MAG: ferric reductase-like transmembrane domain-containing protein [Solirubrobacteraceae bacterium]
MLAAAAVSSSPRVLWYLTRGTGVVTLILLTLTVALGVANRQRLQTSGMPRFVIDAVHRNAALLAVAFLSVHIATTLLDSYVNIDLINVILPFSASYKPLWLGFGAIAFDLLIAVALTSVLRRRLGYRIWRATHWLAYLSWPVAIVHGVGIGSDRHSSWMLALTGACVLIVAAAIVARLRQHSLQPPRPQGSRRPERSSNRISVLTPAAKQR